ncbi:hypothetical protein V8F20_001781 [Naviculisporaceae sp. PSN 640]
MGVFPLILLILSGWLSLVFAEDLLFPYMHGLNYSEYDQAIKLGLTAHVCKDEAEWFAMTTADFAKYKAIVIPDCECNTSLSTIKFLDDTKQVWSPAVTGNMVLIGTDPSFHLKWFKLPGAEAMMNDSLRLVSTGENGTGMYMSLSCYYQSAATPVTIDALSEIGTFKVRGNLSHPCLNDAHLVAQADVMTSLTDESASNWKCSVHEAFSEFPSTGSRGFQALAIALNATGAGQRSFGDGTSGIPYIIARGATPAGCGNNITEREFGEECDDGPVNGTPGNLCSSSCQCVLGMLSPGICRSNTTSSSANSTQSSTLFTNSSTSTPLQTNSSFTRGVTTVTVWPSNYANTTTAERPATGPVTVTVFPSPTSPAKTVTVILPVPSEWSPGAGPRPSVLSSSADSGPRTVTVRPSIVSGSPPGTVTVWLPTPRESGPKTITILPPKPSVTKSSGDRPGSLGDVTITATGPGEVTVTVTGQPQSQTSFSGLILSNSTIPVIASDDPGTQPPRPSTSTPLINTTTSPGVVTVTVSDRSFTSNAEATGTTPRLPGSYTSWETTASGRWASVGFGNHTKSSSEKLDTPQFTVTVTAKPSSNHEVPSGIRPSTSLAVVTVTAPRGPPGQSDSQTETPGPLSTGPWLTGSQLPMNATRTGMAGGTVSAKQSGQPIPITSSRTAANSTKPANVSHSQTDVPVVTVTASSNRLGTTSGKGIALSSQSSTTIDTTQQLSRNPSHKGTAHTMSSTAAATFSAEPISPGKYSNSLAFSSQTASRWSTQLPVRFTATASTGGASHFAETSSDSPLETSLISEPTFHTYSRGLHTPLLNSSISGSMTTMFSTETGGHNMPSSISSAVGSDPYHCDTWIGVEIIHMIEITEICPEGSVVTETATEVVATMTRSICETSATNLPCYPCILGTPSSSRDRATVTVTSCSTLIEPTVTVTVQLCSTCTKTTYTGTVPGYTPGSPCHACSSYGSGSLSTVAMPPPTAISTISISLVATPIPLISLSVGNTPATKAPVPITSILPLPDHPPSVAPSGGKPSSVAHGDTTTGLSNKSLDPGGVPYPTHSLPAANGASSTDGADKTTPVGYPTSGVTPPYVTAGTVRNSPAYHKVLGGLFGLYIMYSIVSF